MKPRAPLAAVDWSDRDVLRKWFADLSAAIEDEIAVTADLLHPPRKRKLGPAESRRIHKEAHAVIRALLDAAERGLVSGSRAKRGAPGTRPRGAAPTKFLVWPKRP